MPMSLVMVSVAVANFVLSLLLVAVICAVGVTGRSTGAVYMPAAVMVPVTGLPPAMPFTLQETVVSVAPVTAAAKVCVLPKRSEAVAGVMVTEMEEGVGGGGGGGTTAVLAPPVLPAQPKVHAAVARRVRIDSAAKRECVAV